tara:strand:+ start:132 stop:788 length:657 start_codon:yes stop_codon:yes gene_type:complete
MKKNKDNSIAFNIPINYKEYYKNKLIKLKLKIYNELNNFSSYYNNKNKNISIEINYRKLKSIRRSSVSQNNINYKEYKYLNYIYNLKINKIKIKNKKIILYIKGYKNIVILWEPPYFYLSFNYKKERNIHNYKPIPYEITKYTLLLFNIIFRSKNKKYGRDEGRGTEGPNEILRISNPTDTSGVPPINIDDINKKIYYKKILILKKYKLIPNKITIYL